MKKTDKKKHAAGGRPYRNSTGDQIWILLFPLVVYYALTVVVLYAAEALLGSDTSHFMLCQIIVDLVTIPAMYRMFYRVDLQLFGPAVVPAYARAPGERLPAVHQVLIDFSMTILISLLIGMSLNVLISMLPIAQSVSYVTTSEEFYGSTLAIELLASGFLTPILEELVYRGILYARVRRLAGLPFAAVFTSAVFAVMHFNLVQGIYAFLVGIVFSLLLEKTGRILCPMVGHMCLNVLAILLTETGMFGGIADGSLGSMAVWGLLLAAGIALLAGFAAPVFWKDRS